MAAVAPETSTSSAATGDVGSSPSDFYNISNFMIDFGDNFRLSQAKVEYEGGILDIPFCDFYSMPAFPRRDDVFD
jgi:hypothetical protein